jgi:hypothetical protein
MTLRNTLIVGLASDQFGNQLANSLQHLTGATNALTVGATNITVGASTSSLGFYGAAVTAKPTGVTLNNVTALATALANLGLIATTS